MKKFFSTDLWLLVLLGLVGAALNMGIKMVVPEKYVDDVRFIFLVVLFLYFITKITILKTIMERSEIQINDFIALMKADYEKFTEENKDSFNN